MTNAKTVKYHSHEWMLLVETGWLTWTVEDGVAVLVYCPRR